MYYPCSENKGDDQLRGYREADLHLCFRLCRLLVFPWGGSNGFTHHYHLGESNFSFRGLIFLMKFPFIQQTKCPQMGRCIRRHIFFYFLFFFFNSVLRPFRRHIWGYSVCTSGAILFAYVIKGTPGLNKLMVL